MAVELSSALSSPSSSISLTRESPALPHSPFLDQSHLSFYGPRRASFSSAHLKIIRPPLMSCRLAPRAVQSLQSFETSIAPEQDLLKELADLKLQMKLKKKALKAQMKERKKTMKEEGRKKQKEGMMMGESSSSSSESSDSECEDVMTADARELRMKEAGQTAVAMAAEGCAMLVQEVRDKERDQSEPLMVKGAEKVAIEAGMMQSEPVIGKGAGELAIGACMMPVRVLPEDRNVDIISVAASAPPVSVQAHEPVTAGRIEVCVGGKCKKAGSEQLLSSLKSQQGLPGEAVGCKCMGRCAMGINVKVQKHPDSNPLVFSHARASDADLILNQSFGVGRPPSGLPSFGGCTAPALTPVGLASSA